MRFRFVELKSKVKFPGDDRVYIKVDSDKCVYLKNGKPDIRDNIHPGTIVECLGEMRLNKLQKLNSGGTTQTYGPHDNPMIFLKLRIMGENGGKDIYVDCRQSEIESTIAEYGAVAHWIVANNKEMRRSAQLAEQNAEIRIAEKLSELAELGL